MNANQIINMVIRLIMRKAINTGINAGIKGAGRVARGRKGEVAPSGADAGATSRKQEIRAARRAARDKNNG